MPQKQKMRDMWVWWGAALFFLAFALLSQRVTPSPAASSTATETKKIALSPKVIHMKAGFLVGELQNLRVRERVDHGTGKPVGVPTLRARLTVTNDSTTQAARLLGGKIEYVDSQGKRFSVADTSFTFIPVPTNRLDPGKHTSQVIEVPFPPGALTPHGLQDVTLELRYLSIPYQVDSASVPVSVGS